MTDQLKRCLEALESSINPRVENQIVSNWVDFYNGKFNGEIFTQSRKTIDVGFDWPVYCINEAIRSYDIMAIQQLGYCYNTLKFGSGGMLNVRSNYGTGILSSVFGAEMYILEDELNTLPITRSVNDIDAIIDKGIPDIYSGYGTQVFEMTEYFIEVMKDYPNIARFAYLYHPDLQSPMDICELLWGSDLFVEFYDNPDKVHRLLGIIADTYEMMMDKWLSMVPSYYEGYSFHWGNMVKGKILLRDDSAMNLSPDFYREFIKPYNERLLKKYGGGVHFCGRGDHFISELSNMEGLYYVNLSQPELNDMEIIYQNTVDKGIVLLGLDKKTVEDSLKQGRSLHSLVTW